MEFGGYPLWGWLLLVLLIVGSGALALSRAQRVVRAMKGHSVMASSVGRKAFQATEPTRFWRLMAWHAVVAIACAGIFVFLLADLVLELVGAHRR